MGTEKYYHSLCFKIKVGLLLSLVAVLAVTSCLRYISFRRLLVESLEPSVVNTEEIIEAQLAAYLRSRLILSAGSVIVILLISDLMMSRMVVNRLKQFLRVVKRVSPGNLDARVTIGGHDEIAELAEGFNRMTEELQKQAEELSTLNTLAATISQSLNLKEVLYTALDEVLELMNLRAGWIGLRNDQGEGLDSIVSRGMPEGVTLAQVQCPWNRSICSEVLELGRPKVFPITPEHLCPAARYFQKEGLICRVCVPLKSKERILGIMSLIGESSDNVQELTEDTLEMLTAIGRQIGIAIENASLYEELHQKEALRRQLLERLIAVQEEERRRIARELHDQTSQSLTSLIMTLKVLEEASSLAEVRGHVGDLRDTVAQTLEEVHNLALELRPSVLDDLGLLAALRHYLREFRDRFRMPVDFQVLGLGDERLPPQVETALYRIVQEALTNVARHTQAQNVSVLLENRDTSVILIVEDNGRGFDVTRVMGSRPHEKNLGLYGMRERASLLDGTLTIESTPGMGTALFVAIPLKQGESNHEKDPSAGG